MRNRAPLFEAVLMISITLFISMCVPPSPDTEDEDLAEQARLDSLRELRCPRLMSSAAEYYRNRDWEATVQVYQEVVELGCDQYDPILAPPEEIYQFYAIAYEYMGQFENSEEVILKGLQKLPENVNLRKRLAYTYRKQAKMDLYINELERIMEMAPSDVQNMMELTNVYKETERYEDQVYVLGHLLELDPDNEILQGDYAMALEKIGEDPLDFIEERWKKNPDNIPYGLDYADRLLAADRFKEAEDVLKSVIRTDNTSKLAYRKLGQAYYSEDDLESSSEIYEELFKLDPRDTGVAIKISEINVELQNYGKAIHWADKAIQISKSSGEALGQKGNVYYKAFQSCRTADISTDDRIVAALAYTYFNNAREIGYGRYTGSMNWLAENEVLFSRANWFMLDNEKKNRGYVKPESACYKWVEEKLKKDPKW